MTTTTPNRPETSFRFGPIEVSIWKRQSTDGVVFLNASVSRSFKKDDAWKRTSSFGTNDIPVLIEQLKQALEYMKTAERPTLG